MCERESKKRLTKVGVGEYNGVYNVNEEVWVFMGRIVFVTSFKGGVGKTTVSANLASALTALGKTVLVADADFGNRCMDLVLGMENCSLFDCNDVAEDRVKPDNAIATREGNRKLFFLPAPQNGKCFPSAEKLSALFRSLRDKYDWILVDSSAEDSALYRAFASVADDALVVSFHQTTAVRSAERTAMTLSELGFKNVRLVVNNYRKDAAERGVLPDILEMIGRSRIRLIGVIPHDGEIPLRQEHGILAFESDTRKPLPYEAAFVNTAKRLCGKSVPLFADVYRPKKTAKYFLD